MQLAKINDPVWFSHQQLQDICRRTLGAERFGGNKFRIPCVEQGMRKSTEQQSSLVADHLIESELRGHRSHGVARLTRYILQLLNGEIGALDSIHISRRI